MVDVSIVMPAHNAALTIASSIESVQKQTFTDWELLVTDDFSSDDTVQIVSEKAKDDPRITLLRHDRNKRAWAARNTSIQAATGRYLAFLDSDDLWTVDKLEKSLKLLAERNASFVFTAFTRFKNDPQVVSSKVSVPPSVGYWKLLGDNVIATSTVLVDRNVHGKIVMPESYYDDFACWLSLLKGGSVAHGLNIPLMHYRETPGSLSRNKVKSSVKTWQVMTQEQRLPLPAALYCFVRYSVNGVFKHYAPGIYNLKHK